MLGSLIPQINDDGILVTGTYTLSLTQYSKLQTAWGSVYVTFPGNYILRGVVVTRLPAPSYPTSSNQFVCVTEVCTHQGNNINTLNSATQTYTCPTHNSIFKLHGVVQQGPAYNPLQEYTTNYDGADTLQLLGIPGIITGVAEQQTPQQAELEQNYPNPLSVSTSIEYTLAAPAQVALTVYTLDGREVTRLVEGHQGAGAYKVALESSGLQSGTYFYTLRTSTGFNQSRRLVVTK